MIPESPWDWNLLHDNVFIRRDIDAADPHD
jgi:hypothetical protein